MTKGIPTACLMALNPIGMAPHGHVEVQDFASKTRETVYRGTSVSNVESTDLEDGSRTLKLTVHCAPDKRLLMLEKFTMEKTEQLTRSQGRLEQHIDDIKGWLEDMKREQAEHIETADKNFSNITAFLSKVEASTKAHTKVLEGLGKGQELIAADISELQKKNDIVDEELRVHDGRIKSLEVAVADHRESIAALGKSVVNVEAKLQSLADDFVAVDEFELLKRQVHVQDERTMRFVEELRAELKTAGDRISALEASYAELRESAAKPCIELGERLDDVETQQSDLEARVGKVETAAVTLGERVNTEAEKTAAVISDVHAVAADVHAVASDVHAVTSDVHAVTADVHGVQKSVEDLTARVAANEKNIAIIDEGVQKMNKTVGVMGQRLVQMATNVNQGCAAVLTEA